MRKRRHKVTEKDIQYISKYANKIPAKAMAEALDMNQNTIYRVMKSLGIKPIGYSESTPKSKSSKGKPSENKPSENNCDGQMVTIEDKTQSVAEWIRELYDKYQALYNQMNTVGTAELLPNEINIGKSCELILRFSSSSQTSL